MSSAVLDIAASLGVSRSIGYVDNGSGLGGQVTVSGVAGCEPWFETV